MTCSQHKTAVQKLTAIKFFIDISSIQFQVFPFSHLIYTHILLLMVCTGILCNKRSFCHKEKPSLKRFSSPGQFIILMGKKGYKSENILRPITLDIHLLTYSLKNCFHFLRPDMNLSSEWASFTLTYTHKWKKFFLVSIATTIKKSPGKK